MWAKHLAWIAALGTGLYIARLHFVNVRDRIPVENDIRIEFKPEKDGTSTNRHNSHIITLYDRIKQKYGFGDEIPPWLLKECQLWTEDDIDSIERRMCKRLTEANETCIYPPT